MATRQYLRRAFMANQQRNSSFGTVTATKGEGVVSGRPIHNKYAMTGEFAPVYVVMGFVSVAVAIGLHTAKQQLVHAPGVSISKKRRESLPELDIPDVVTSDGDKFINKSFLRKVGRIQKDHHQHISSSST
ncbi:uncharacterized protein LOC126674264 [Mercurialis annua]|uniref:uncharacterized protein LOC126674264 n=1 Tax=Mercurialis annua TaxID=3986 RepID=UPI00215EA8B7|nr:uncharacterized protein LOC126674264 [Mercurialis annua]